MKFMVKNCFIVLCMGLFSVAARAEGGFSKSVDSLSEFFSSVDIEDISENVQGVYDSVKQKLEDSNVDVFEPINSMKRLMIHYPDWWDKKPDSFSEAVSFIKDNCADSYKLPKLVLMGSESEYRTLYDKLKDENKRCSTNVLNSMARQFKSYDIPWGCLEKEHHSHKICRDVFDFTDTASHRLLDMAALAYGEAALDQAKPLSICYTCAGDQRFARMRDLLNIFEIIQTAKSYQYPDWWDKKPGAFSKALSILDDEKCFTFQCYNLDLSYSLLRGSESEYHTLYNKLKNKDQRCSDAVLKIMNILFQSDHIPKQCLKKENHSHKACRNMLNYVNIAKQRFLDIAALAYGEAALPPTESMSICHECVSGKQEPTIEEILNLQDALKAAAAHSSSCKKLNPGEEKTVFSNTGITDIPYKINRELDGSYNVPLFLNFSADEDYDGPVAREKVPDHYMQKAQKCLMEASQKMLGPNGEKLKINIQQAPNQSNLCNTQKVRNIAIGSKSFRSNMEKYAADVDCSIITHEVLHLLGLPDEYKEEYDGYYVHSETGEINNAKAGDKNYRFQSAHDCRVTFSNSIMNVHWERWYNTFKYGQNKSLLAPRHFNSILYGDCDSNKTVNECFKLAQKSSVENKNCIEKRDQCMKQMQ